MNTTRLCVPVCASNVTELLRALERAAEVADIIEVRLDCLPSTELDEALRLLSAWSSSISCPLLWTLRAREQGGNRDVSRDERRRLWSKFGSDASPEVGGADFVDVELHIIEGSSDETFHHGFFDWGRVVCSHHDFDGVPADLEAIYERAAQTPAHLIKIAVHARDITDCLPVLRLLEHAGRDGREMIAIAMGDAGVLTRVLAPSRGAFLTFGALDDEHATAPGQVIAADLRDLYRIHTITERTIITGLVGSPVSHSLSPQMHNRAFAEKRVDAVYIPFEVGDINGFMRRMVNPRTRELRWNLRGFSVTAPHKTAVMPYLDSVDSAAAEVGAVNTILIEEDELRGYNTDAAASLVAIERAMDLRGRRVAVLGAGGAARAVLWSLRRAGATTTVFARNPEQGEGIARSFDSTYEKLTPTRKFADFDVVINTTPLGTRGKLEDETPLDRTQLAGVELAYDLVYNPSPTRFMREAAAANCITRGGLEMLVHQAAAQFKLWTNLDAPLDTMRRAAEDKLENS